MLKKLRALYSKWFLGYEHDWTNDFYLSFFDKDGNKLSQNQLNNIWGQVNETKITKGQNPNNNSAGVLMHSDKGYLHNLWVVGHKGDSSVADWFNSQVSGGYGAAIGIRSDYDQKTKTGLPQKMNFAVNNTLYVSIDGVTYYTNYVWGMVGADKWKVFKHTVSDVAKSIFKDSIMEELEVPDQIAETVSVMDATTTLKDTWSASENNYYFGVVNNSQVDVRKINWGKKSNKDQTAIITRLISTVTYEPSDSYIIFKSCNCFMKDGADGNGLNGINVYCVNF